MAAVHLSLIVSIFHVAVAFASDGSLIRGIPLERAVLYDPSKDFVCLDGTVSVPFSFVNDDYCDCADGSDEPGTAACPNGTFYCPNSGHVPLVIPSSRVNDGICDCCDTSDEYGPGPGGDGCVNTCASMGEAARERYLRAMREQEAGYRGRLELVSQANAKRNELLTKANDLRALKGKAEEEVREKEAAKREVEEREKAALAVHRGREEEARARRAEEESERREVEMRGVWNSLDGDADGLLSVAEVQSDLRFDQNRDGAVSPEEARFFTLNQDSIGWEDFSRTGWILMRPYVVANGKPPTPMFTPPEPEGEQEEEPPAIVSEPLDETATEEPGKTRSDEDDEEDDVGVGDGDGGAGAEFDYEDEVGDVGQRQEGGEDAAPTAEPALGGEDSGYDEETQLLVDQADEARKRYNEADRSLRDLEHELNGIQAVLEKDFGPDDSFLPLDGQCIEHTDREYVYKLCLFQQATQKPKHGGGETKLGSWKSWAGSSSNPYEKMLYDHGLGCWNGPDRSAQVALSCGKETRITSVSEPSRCLYYFEVETPAVCTQPPSLPESAAHLQWHEEL